METTPVKAVVVHAGARDAYQLALALDEAGMLEALVTDLFCPAGSSWLHFLPEPLAAMLRQRSAALASSRIKLTPFAGLRTLLLDKLPGVPFSRRRAATRRADAILGRTAGRLARRTRTGLVSYSYTAYDAFSNFPGRGILFQAHPHPATMRRILTAELQMHPDCAESLRQEWELSLPEADYQRLAREPALAQSFLAASSFTRDSLVEHGTPVDAVRVIPYGVDLGRFHPDGSRRGSGRLELLFVGRINQRKGVKYLLEALRLLDTQHVHLTICGRVVDGLDIFEPFSDRVTIRPSVSPAELVAAYQAADLFVFPSIGEGFGQVLLEALASGLPILSTTSTAAPDLIQDGEEGWVIEPRRPDVLAARIESALGDETGLRRMSVAARQRAERFTWERFRTQVAVAVREFLET